MNSESKAVILDRDGVLVEDVDFSTNVAQLRILPGVPEALTRLAQAGFKFAVVTNQAMIARGLGTEAEVAAINQTLADQLVKAGAPRIEKFYVCPHHPKANLSAYRLECECRKPQPGMLRQAAKDLDFNLTRSFMVGDRVTDIVAGKSAGCRTIWVETGKHTEAVIETSNPIDQNIKADWTCAGLPEAAQWILSLK